MNESDSKNMSPEEKNEAIEQFCRFTGASKDQAKVTLEACNWNLELAVNMHVDGIDTGEPVDVLPTPETSSAAGASSTAGASSSAAASATTTNEPGPASSAVVCESSSSEEVRPPIPPVRQVLEDGFHGHQPSNPSQSVFDAFRNLQADARWLEEGEGVSSSSNLSKKRPLEELFRPPLEPLYRGPMDQVNISSMAGISASPPRFMALEEIMKAANGVYNMCLAHEIAMDKEFKLEKTDSTPNTLHKRVDDMMRKVFWELLQNELDESPPNYKRALVLLAEIKENLTSFLLPQHTRLKQEIEEILDLDLIKQQAENGALDFQRYAHYILSVMARLCAPIRDEKIRQLTQTREVLPLFRGIMELLDEMRLDMANFLVQQIRPQILQQSVAYERKKFTEFLESQTKMGNNDGLEYTKKWLKRNYVCHDYSGESNKEIISKVLTSAYTELLIWDESVQETFPETLLLDEKRIISLRDFITLNILVGSALLVTVAAFPSVQSLSDLKEEIRDHLLIVLDEKDDKSNDIESRLEAAALQIIADFQKHIEKQGCTEIDPLKAKTVKDQVVDLKNKNNRIRQVVQRRMLEFVECVFTSNTASPVQTPKGLTALQQNLSSIAGQFMRIASHNRAVYENYYADIITDLINSKI